MFKAIKYVLVIVFVCFIIYCAINYADEIKAMWGNFIRDVPEILKDVSEDGVDRQLDALQGILSDEQRLIPE